MSGIITIGETMAAFTPGANGPLRYVGSFGIRSAGAESNVAVGLAKLDVPAAWISRVGQDEFGHFLRNAIRAEGVDCSKLIFDPEHRTGVMFKEVSAGGTSVYYYRENSAASHLCPDDLKEEWFAEADIVHLSGITPVLSESCKAMIYRAFELAKQHGALVSFDPNIRKKLWKDNDFTPMIREMTLMSDIVLIGLDEAKVLFGTEDIDSIVETLRTQGSAKYIAIKDGGNGAWVADVKQCVHVPPYPCNPIEPIGAGDGFNAGFLAGLIKGKDLVTAGRMGGICGALATQVPGDVEGYPDSLQMEKALAGLETIYR